MNILPYCFILLAYAVVVNCSSAKSCCSKKEKQKGIPASECRKEGYPLLMRYRGAIIIQCRRAVKPHANAFYDEHDLMDGVTTRMFCDAITSNFDDSCKIDEGCSPVTVCIKSLEWEFWEVQALNIGYEPGFFTEDEFLELGEDLHQSGELKGEYDLHYGNVSKLTKHDDYYVKIECEDCGGAMIHNCKGLCRRVKNCAILEKGTNYFAQAYRPEVALGTTHFIVRGYQDNSEKDLFNPIEKEKCNRLDARMDKAYEKTDAPFGKREPGVSSAQNNTNESKSQSSNLCTQKYRLFYVTVYAQLISIYYN